ncbi:MAG: MFS transporter [Actinomycetota bacterium]|nr:MFS transporter [Actinomycetota bacterium]MDA8358052.1 MFS transporter [Actinomycetota bacterium]
MAVRHHSFFQVPLWCDARETGRTVRKFARPSNASNAATSGMGVPAPPGQFAAGDGRSEEGIELRTGGLGSPGQAAALATLCMVLFLTFLDNTVVSVGLADIQTSLHAGVTALQWVVDGYALTFATFMLAAGTMGDLLGRKKAMLTGVAIFCGGSIVCATAPSSGWLIAGRVIMGIGAAASEPGTLSVLRHVYPDRATRANALGVWAAVSGLSLALGPVIAGTLVGVSSWRAIFWFNLGFGLLAFSMALTFVPESSDPEGRQFDWAGMLLGGAALGAVSFAIIQGELFGYATWWIDGLFAASVLFGVVFLLVERARTSPMIDLGLFRRPPFFGSNFVAFATFFGTFSIFFFTALYVQVVITQSAYQTALDFLPMAAALILGSALAGPWVARAGARVPMVVGCTLAATGIFITSATLGAHSGFGTLGWTLPIAGLGFGIALVPVTSAALTVVPPQRSGMAASATNTSRELGAVVGVAVLGAVVDSKLTGELAYRLRALGIPPSFQSLVINAVSSGGLSSSAASQAEHSHTVHVANLATKVVHAAYEAFGSGLHLSFDIAGSLLALSAVVAAVTVRRPRSLERYEP